MCIYMKENNGKVPYCTHACSGCMWHEDEEDQEEQGSFSPDERQTYKNVLEQKSRDTGVNIFDCFRER